MSMTIPEETIRKARELWVGLMGHPTAQPDEVNLIATALHSAQMEERERCAKAIYELADSVALIGRSDGKGLASLLRAEATRLRTTGDIIRTTKAD